MRAVSAARRQKERQKVVLQGMKKLYEEPMNYRKTTSGPQKISRSMGDV